MRSAGAGSCVCERGGTDRWIWGADGPVGPPPDGLVVSITIPPTVEMGREFQTVVTLRNDSDKEIKVSEIQVPKVLLEIAALNTTSPLYSDSTVYTQ